MAPGPLDPNPCARGQRQTPGMQSWHRGWETVVLYPQGPILARKGVVLGSQDPLPANGDHATHLAHGVQLACRLRDQLINTSVPASKPRATDSLGGALRYGSFLPVLTKQGPVRDAACGDPITRATGNLAQLEALPRSHLHGCVWCIARAPPARHFGGPRTPVPVFTLAFLQ